MFDRPESKSSVKDYAYLERLLTSITTFKKKHKRLTYFEFDNYVSHELSLFLVGLGFDYLELKKSIVLLNKVLPAVKHIFSKPIVVLKDSPEVLPVELITKISNKSLHDLGNHANNVENIKRGRVIPKKLLTEISETDYSIYENVVFCNFVEGVVKYCRYNMNIIKKMLYESEIMEFNLLERFNHIDYFLSLGKLHTGYIRNFNRNIIELKKTYHELKEIVNALSARMIRPVYKQNKHRNRKLKLKKTNIFIMQKDYHKVFLTYKYFLNHSLMKTEEEPVDLDTLKTSYRTFVNMLAIFAAGNFNFTMKPNADFNVETLDCTFNYKNWSLKMKTIKDEGLLLSINKDVKYDIMLYPTINFDVSVDTSKTFSERVIDDFVYCSPFEENVAGKHSAFLSPESINSFRRVQQLILEGMIYSDTSHKECPFCGGHISYDMSTRTYVCDDCRTQIKKVKCPNTKKVYYYTDIANYIFPDFGGNSLGEKDDTIFFRKLESALYFRNITEVDINGNVICPRCGESHANINHKPTDLLD